MPEATNPAEARHPRILTLLYPSSAWTAYNGQGYVFGGGSVSAWGWHVYGAGSILYVHNNNEETIQVVLAARHPLNGDFHKVAPYPGNERHYLNPQRINQGPAHAGRYFVRGPAVLIPTPAGFRIFHPPIAGPGYEVDVAPDTTARIGPFPAYSFMAPIWFRCSQPDGIVIRVEAGLTPAASSTYSPPAVAYS